MKLRKMFRFEASHILPKHSGKCSRLHGHSWVLHVEVDGDIDPETGFVMDFAEISNKVHPLIERLDHRHLGQWADEGHQNSIPTRLEFVAGLGTSHCVQGLPMDFYPSSENLLYWIGANLIVERLRWSKLTLEETCTSSVELTREEFYSRAERVMANAEREGEGV